MFSCLKYLNLRVRGVKYVSLSGLGPFSLPSLKRWKVPRPCWNSFYRFSSIFLLIHLIIFSFLLAVSIAFAVLVFPGNPVILSACFPCNPVCFSPDTKPFPACYPVLSYHPSCNFFPWFLGYLCLFLLHCPHCVSFSFLSCNDCPVLFVFVV